jgi:Phage Mu protein F like protein
MLQVLDKAGTSRAHADRLLATQTRAIRLAFEQYRQAAAGLSGVPELLSQGKIEQVLQLLDRPIANFGNAWVSAFIDAASATTAHLARRLVRKAPTIALSFETTDPRAVALMERDRLALVTGLTRHQRAATRLALIQGMREGLSAAAMARTFRGSIGMTERDLVAVERFRRAQLAGRAEELELPEGPGRVVSSPAHIARLAERKQQQLLQARALAIARTEALRVTSLAQDQALRQNIEATRQSAQLTGKEWASTRDARTRDRHAARDGQRRRLDDAFDGGIMRPGDGGPEESVNCRCTLLFEFFDTEAELQEWLRGGS